MRRAKNKGHCEHGNACLHLRREGGHTLDGVTVVQEPMQHPLCMACDEWLGLQLEFRNKPKTLFDNADGKLLPRQFVLEPSPETDQLIDKLKASGMRSLNCQRCGCALLTRTASNYCPPCREEVH